MNCALLKFTVSAFFAALLVGCAHPIDRTLLVKRGGYLEDNDYVAFQKEADLRKPISLPKKWPSPSPIVSYTFESDFDFRSLDRISIPDLHLAPMSGSNTKWPTHKHIPLFQQYIANHTATLLLSENLVKEAPRSANGPVTLVGAITFFKDGSFWGGQFEGAGSQTFMQTEFKVMANGRKVGAIQVYAVRPKTFVGVVMDVPTVEEQIAKGAVTAIKGMKTNFREDPKNEFVVPDWFIK